MKAGEVKGGDPKVLARATKKLVVDIGVDTMGVVIAAIPNIAASDEQKAKFTDIIDRKAHGDDIRNIEQLTEALTKLSQVSAKPITQIIGDIIALANCEVSVALPGNITESIIAATQTILLDQIALGLSKIPNIALTKDVLLSQMKLSLAQNQAEYAQYSGEGAAKQIADSYVTNLLHNELPDATGYLAFEIIGDLISLAGNQAYDNINA
jgi:hypothetical protein